MDDLKRQVRKAQWFLGLQRFVGVLGWCWFGALLMALAGIVGGRIWPLGIEDWVWGTGALGTGLVAAVVWAFAASRGPMDAAIEIDRRFGLKERISSTLVMSPEERETDAGQALLRDAVRRAERIDVRDQFAIAPGRQLLLPLGPGILALLVALLVSPAGENPAQGKSDPAAIKSQITKSSQSFQLKLAEKREEAKKQGLKDAQKLFLKLQEELAKHETKMGEDRKEAVVKLNDLARQLEKRTRELGGAEAIQRQLEQLKNAEKGPADNFLRAVARGDVKEALKELEKIKADLANNRLTDQQKQDLAKQLDQMQKNLDKMIEAHRKAQEDLKKQIEQIRQSGQTEQADKLEEQLMKLQQQLPQMNKLQDLSQKLGQCSQCIKEGKLQGAAETLSQVQSELQDLRQQLEEFSLLQDAKDELDQARRQMLCKQCNGAGCAACGGGDEDGEGKPGMGLGKGRGAGPRPEEKTETESYDTRASVKTRPGAGTIVGEVEGPNIKGDVQQTLIEMERKARTQAADPLTDLRMPRKHRQNVQEYFDRLREGK